MASLRILSCGHSGEHPIDDAVDGIPFAAHDLLARPGWLTDPQGRHLRYLRLSITDRCDLRCAYCMPEGGAPASSRDDVLSLEEVVRVVRVFGMLGVRTVRLTGGEPLVRRGIADLVRMIRDEVGIDDIAMTTNATILEHVARDLVDAGLRRINVSLDSTRVDRFHILTRGGDLPRVLRGIDAVIDAGISEIESNTVVIRGVNDDHLGEIVDFAWNRGVTPRFIELMPVGEGAKLGSDAVVSVREMKALLTDRIEDPRIAGDAHDGRGPARYLREKDGTRKVGFIGAVTENFCERCNRVRVTARGEIRACLASPQGFSLRDAIRAGAGDEEIVERVRVALFGKARGHAFGDAVVRHQLVEMSRVGG